MHRPDKGFRTPEEALEFLRQSDPGPMCFVAVVQESNLIHMVLAVNRRTHFRVNMNGKKLGGYEVQGNKLAYSVFNAFVTYGVRAVTRTGFVVMNIVRMRNRIHVEVLIPRDMKHHACFGQERSGVMSEADFRQLVQAELKPVAQRAFQAGFKHGQHQMKGPRRRKRPHRVARREDRQPVSKPGVVASAAHV